MGDEEKIEIKIEGGKFKQFDIIEKASSFSDHHYYNHRPKRYSDQLRKRISQEWDTMKVQLPDSIFVRANMERPDLLRAVIVGPQGSPFHDGLFFFDIQFLPKYPDIRPKIYYCCYDVRLMNPYANSMEPFAQKKIPWSSSTSTVLGLLLLIHRAQVRTADTLLFYDWPENLRERETLLYKEMVFVENWKTMVSVHNKPPKCFEEFVSRYFQDQAETILTTCKAYISGRVKTADTDTGISVLHQEKFDEMESIYYKLVIAFQKNGLSLENFSKLRIEFHGKPFYSQRTMIIIETTGCIFCIGVVILMYFVLRGSWKEIKAILQA